MPLFFFTLYLAAYVLFRAARPRKIALWGTLIASFLFALFNAGFSEAFTVMQILFLATAIGIEWLENRSGNQKNIAFLVAGLAGAVIAIGIMLTAPGNANRQEAFRQPSGVMEILSISLNGYMRFWGQFFLAPHKITGFLGALTIFFSAGAQVTLKRKPTIVEVVGLIAFGLLFPYISFPPAAYGIGDTLPDRAQTIPIFFIVISMMTAGFLAGNRFTGSGQTFPVLLAGTALLLVSSGINIQHLVQTRHIYIEYAQRMDQVEKQILAAREGGEASIQIPKLYNWAGTFDPSDNPKFWVTFCISKYYDIQVLAPAWKHRNKKPGSLKPNTNGDAKPGCYL
jgi:hypothetical protein